MARHRVTRDGWRKLTQHLLRKLKKSTGEDLYPIRCFVVIEQLPDLRFVFAAKFRAIQVNPGLIANDRIFGRWRKFAATADHKDHTEEGWDLGFHIRWFDLPTGRIQEQNSLGIGEISPAET